MDQTERSQSWMPVATRGNNVRNNMLAKATYFKVISNKITYNVSILTLNHTIIYSIYIQDYRFETKKQNRNE